MGFSCMWKLTIFALVACISLTLQSTALMVQHQAFRYTQQKFALTWPGSFCQYSRRCNNSWFSNWNKKSFIIHGLWPNSPQPGFVRAVSRRADPGCTARYRFNLGWLDQNTIARLNQVMPDLTQNNLWQHQWDKHGTCYLKLLNDKVNRNPNIHPQYAQKIFTKYFQSMLSLYARLSGQLRPRRGSYNNANELAADLGLHPNQLSVSVSNGKLNEIQICVSLPNNDNDNERVVTCDNRPHQPNRPFVLPGFHA